MNFEEIEETILQKNTRAIRLEKTKKKTVKEMGLESFLVKFFTEWNNEKNTIYADDKSIQTDMEKRRSLGDIYMICKYYFPDMTLKELFHLLYNKLFDLVNEGFRTSHCNTIHKRVWYHDPVKQKRIWNLFIEDEFGNTISDFYQYNIDIRSEFYAEDINQNDEDEEDIYYEDPYEEENEDLYEEEEDDNL